jgi:hypothetical protein
MVVSFGVPPADTARTTARTTGPIDSKTVPKGIGARLGPSARLIDESINDLRALGSEHARHERIADARS